MWRKKMITIASVVFGALLFGSVASLSGWGWNAQNNVELPTVSASWTEIGSETSAVADPAQVNVAMPPYIIFDAHPVQRGQGAQQHQVRISIQPMSGSSSEYLASRKAAPESLPAVFVRSVKLGSFGESPSGLKAWE